MHKINKVGPTVSFSKFVKQKNPSVWEDLPSDIRRDARSQILVLEQDCLCGYTELPLDDGPESSHIDHFVKRDHDHTKIFDWNNLVVSTIDEDFGGKYKDNKYQIQRNGYQNIFNPVVEDMSQYLQYFGDGEMAAKNGINDNTSRKVEETIKAFNLNHSSLKRKRADLILELSTYLDQKELLDDPAVKKAFVNRGFVSLWNWYIGNNNPSK